MYRYPQHVCFTILGIFILAFTNISVSPVLAATQTFSNPESITILDRISPISENQPRPADPYPSNIVVSGFTGVVTDVNVTLSGFGHTFPDDVDVLLVGPGGQTVILMSDAGCNVPVSGINLTFDQSAGASLPNTSAIPGDGTYLPTDYANSDGECFDGLAEEIFPSPAPTAPYGTSLDVFNGTDPNGTWSLYVVDDAVGDNGSISGGWSLEITITEAPTITSVASASVAVGDAFSHTFTAAGNPAPGFTYSDESLPPGVNLIGDTLLGTPTTPGDYSITVTASNGISPDAVQVFEITVTGDAPVITSAASATVAVGTLFSHTFEATGNPVPSFTYSAEDLPPGVTRTGDTLSGAPIALGDYSITATASNGVDPDAVQVFTIMVTGDAPVITSVATGYVEQHAPFSHTFTAAGNPAPTLTYSDENLPPGITRTGDMLSGIATHDGQFSVTLTASNGVDPEAEQVFILTVGGLPVPPPTPLCEDHNFSEDGVVRSSTADAFGHALNCRVLYQNGAPTSWMGGSLYNGGSIGVEGIFELGVQTAIDIFSPSGVSYFEGGAVFCLKGSGYLIWLAAEGAPRVPEVIGSYAVPEFPGFTCATLFEPGTLVLVSQNPVR